MDPDREDALRPKDAAPYLGVSARTLFLYVEKGLLPRYLTPGGQSRYLRSDLDAIRNNRPKRGRPFKQKDGDDGPD